MVFLSSFPLTMATTFEQLKAAANMLQAAMASEDEKTRADALSVMYAVGRTVAPSAGVSGQQQSSPRSPPPPPKARPAKAMRAAAARGQPAAAAAIAPAAESSSSSVPAGRASSPISSVLRPAETGPSQKKYGYARCRPARLMELVAANPATATPLTQQELTAMAQKFENKDGKPCCGHAGIRKRRDVFCTPCRTKLMGEPNFANWYRINGRLARHQLDAEDGLSPAAPTLNVTGSRGEGWAASAAPAAPPRGAEATPAGAPQRIRGVRRFRAVAMAARFCIRANLALRTQDAFRRALADWKINLQDALGLQLGENAPEVTFQRARAHLHASIGALAAMQKNRRRQIQGMPVSIAKWTAARWSGTTSSANLVIAIKDDQEQRVLREASWSTERSSSRPFLRHRAPRVSQTGRSWGVSARHAPTAEVLEDPAPSGVTCSACRAKRSRTHYAHGKGVCQWAFNGEAQPAVAAREAAVARPVAHEEQAVADEGPQTGAALQPAPEAERRRSRRRRSPSRSTRPPPRRRRRDMELRSAEAARSKRDRR